MSNPKLSLSRRSFFQATLVAGAGLTAAPSFAGEAPRRFRAAVIGHTGGGDYGHGYDRIFNGLNQVEVVAVADPDAAGARKAAERCGAKRTYADYQQLLAEQKPDLVSIAMRYPRVHKTVALACLEAGAHLFVEKPLTETLAEADAIVAAARQRSAQIVVAHNRRYTPDFQRVKALLAEGFVGRVREFHIHGKQDARAGGEDMMVLGTHDFDLLRFYFGDPQWCSATVLVGGQEATQADARDGHEPIRVLGDTIRAQFGFPGNLAASWESVTTDDGWNQPKGPREHWAFEILGTRRIIAYQSGAGFGYLDSPDFLQPTSAVKWQPLPEPHDFQVPAQHRHLGRDLIHAVETGEPPLCSAADGRWAIEMLTAVYQSHLSRRRVALPLSDRHDPLR